MDKYEASCFPPLKWLMLLDALEKHKWNIESGSTFVNKKRQRHCLEYYGNFSDPHLP